VCNCALVNETGDGRKEKTHVRSSLGRERRFALSPGVKNLHLRQESNIAAKSIHDTIRLPLHFYLDGLQIRYVTDVKTLDGFLYT